MFDGEMTGFTKILHGLGFPSSIIAALGAFTFGVGIFQSDVSLTNRKMLAGLLLIAVGVLLWYTPRIITSFSISEDGEKWKTYRKFSFGALLGAIFSAVTIYYLARILWPLLQTVTANSN